MENEYENEKLKLKIEQDEDAEDPRGFDNLGIMVCFHKRYNLGDKTNLTSDQFSGWDELEDYLIKNEKARVILPLYLLDHSGLAIRTEPFYEDVGGWDSGQVGFIYTTDEKIKKFYGNKKPSAKEIKDSLESEVRTYNDYLEGNVYTISLEEKEICNLGDIHTKQIDSIGGFYGYPDKNQILDFLNGVEIEKDLEPYLEDIKKKIVKDLI